MNQVLTIAGSARGDGNTAEAVARLRLALDGGEVIDLASCRLEPFRYELPPARDDFLTIVERMLAHRHILIATPVYWYAMSGLMKTLFDRFTDLLLDPELRPLGRALAGRDLWLLATGTDEALPDGFEEPFRRTADYFAMRWRGSFYTWVDKDSAPAEQDFSAIEELARALGSEAGAAST